MVARPKESGKYVLQSRIVAPIDGDAIVVPGEEPLPLADLRQAHEGWLPGFMSGEL